MQFELGKKIDWYWFALFDAEDKGFYFIEDHPVYSVEELNRLNAKYL